ncbi:MAG: translocation/assembly module TamB [Candidatus Azobacteroides sp.]|nr:translocation/assembly module TamB [Candidatus Azobacteroides sp.]
MLTIIISLFSIILVIYSLLWLPAVQQKIKTIAVNELNRSTNGQISIGNLYFRPFNKIVLENVYIPDLRGDTLLYAQHLSTGFSLRGLLRNKLRINSVELNNFTMNVSQDSINSPYNFQFLIDAFASSDTIQSGNPLIIRIDDISLAGGILRYNILSQKKQSEGFDPNHIHIYDFNSRISLKSIDIENLNVELKSLTLKETSGLYLKNLSGKIVSNKKIIDAKDWLLQLPNSELKIGLATLDYTGLEFKDWMQNANYSLSLDIPKLSPTDLQAFYRPLKNSQNEIKLHLKSFGKFPGIKIENLQTSFGDFLSLNVAGNIDDYTNWDKSLFKLYVNNLTINSEAIRKISNLIMAKPQPIPPKIVRLGRISLAGSIKGSLPDAYLNLLARTSTGNLNLNGTGGYQIASNTGIFDIKLESGNFNLRDLLGDSSFGIIDLNANTQGTIANGNVSANAGIQLNRFDFNRYSYQNIRADVNYSNDIIDLSLVSRDPNLSIILKGNANMNPQRQTIDLYAKSNHIRLDTLNLSTNLASLSFALNTKISGFDLEKTDAKIAIDSLSFTNENGTIKQGPIRLDYLAAENNRKSAKITSDIINADVHGKAILTDLLQAFSNTMSAYLPAYFSYKKIQKDLNSDINLNINILNTENLSNVFNIPFAIIEPAHVKASYREAHQFADMNINMPKIKLNNTILDSTLIKLQTDTTLLRMHATAQSMLTGKSDSLLFKLNMLAGHDSVSLATNFESISSGWDLHGSLALDAYFTRMKQEYIPNIFISILPTSVYVNRQAINIEPSELAIQKDHFNIDHFKISLSENEFMTINGAVSENKTDTLFINPSHIKVQTLMQILYPNIDLKGEINGKFVLTQLLSSPRLFTNNLTVKDITLAGKKIGTINLSSIWDNNYRGMGIKATLTQENATLSEIAGMILPEQDSIRLRANINDIQLDWLTPFTQDYLYGLTGSLGAKINATGKLSAPAISGNLTMKDTKFGIKMTNTAYNISDTISIRSNNLSFKDFKITDENKQAMTINGAVTHNNFRSFKSDIRIGMRDFLILNNPNATDSLFCGNLKMNGSIAITGSEKELLVDMVLSNSGKGKVFIRMPESYSHAQQFNSITFINPADTLPSEEKKVTHAPKTTTWPVKLKTALSVNPELTIGTIINPATRDEAGASGTGNIDFSYDMNNDNMSILGRYTVDNGKFSLSLKNITNKTFNIQRGSEVIFNEDPMKTSFNITAVYSLRADLATLDPSFKENPYLSSTNVNVNCLITISGNLDKINVQYNIVLPNASEDLQQQVAGLIYSDEIKIKQIAHLLTLGTFWPPDNNIDIMRGNSIWTSLASSTLTTQLNNLLSGVLNENWTIGTDLHANDSNMSDLEMDLFISTHLFNDRLTFTGNLGYRNSSLSNTNFTGDFEIDYKLNQSGNVILRAFNVTNNQFYERAATTQGVGIAYKQEAKTFGELFKKIKRRWRSRNQNQ